MCDLHNGDQFPARRKGKNMWRSIRTCIAAVLCITSALVMPALSTEIQCELAHTHTEACIGLICGKKEVNDHFHSAACYPKEPICGQEHEHTDACYDRENPICGLEESTEHFHHEECYTEEKVLTCPIPEGEVHIHTDDCYVSVDAMVCGLEETEGHSHDESCYNQENQLACGQQACQPHVHSDACHAQQRQLVCTREENVPHVHGEGCYTPEKKLTCGLIQPEVHHHSEACYGPICGREEHVCGVDCDLGVAEEPTASGRIPVTGITGSNAAYDPATGLFDAELRIDISFDVNGVNAATVYSFTYPKGILVPSDLLNNGKDFCDAASIKAGTYWFVRNEDGGFAVQIQLDGTYLKGKTDPVVGFVSFHGWVDAQRNEKGDLSLTAGDNLVLTIPSGSIRFPDNATDSQDITLYQSGTYQQESSQLCYTVAVHTTKGTSGSIQITDTLTADGLTLGTPSVTVQKTVTRQYEGWSEPYGVGEEIAVTPSVEQDAQGDWIIFMTLGQLNRVDDGGKGYYDVDDYVITYTYPIEAYQGQTFLPSNKVRVSFQDQFGNPVWDSAEMSFEIHRLPSINKSGQYHAFQGIGRIDWTIDINANGLDLQGAILTDEMFAGLDEGDIHVEPRDAFEILTGEAGVTGIRFRPIGDTGVNTGKYTVTYSTSVAEAWEAIKITNTATLDPTPDTPGDEVSSPAIVCVEGGGIAVSMDDAAASMDGRTADVTWTVTLAVPKDGIPDGITILCDPTKQEHGEDNLHDQWLTRAQILDWAYRFSWLKSDGTVHSQLDVSPESVTYSASDGKTYAYSQIAAADFDEALTFTEFAITLAAPVMPPEGCSQLTFTYHTTADLSEVGIGKSSYGNRIQAGGKEAWAEYSYYQAGVQTTDHNNSTADSSTSSDGQVVWKVVAAVDDRDHTKLTLVDTLPMDQVVLQSLKLTGDSGVNLDLDIDAATGTITGTDSSNQIGVTGTCQGDTVTLEITPKDGTLPHNGVFTLFVTCMVNNAQNQTGTVELVNSAVMKLEDEAYFPNASQKQSWTYKSHTEEMAIVNMTGSWDSSNRRLNYSVLLNPDGDVLVDPDQTLTLMDELRYHGTANAMGGGSEQYDITISLLQNTVKLYHAVPHEDGTWEKGAEVSGWKWIANGPVADGNTEGMMVNIIHATGIPNATPMILEYRYSVALDAPEGAQFFLGDISNTVRLVGAQYQDLRGASATVTLTDTRNVTQTPENNQSATLPCTGGTGTTMFYVFGWILVIGAVVLLVSGKRKNPVR